MKTSPEGWLTMSKYPHPPTLPPPLAPPAPHAPPSPSSKISNHKACIATYIKC